MLTEGTKTLTSKQIADEIDFIGGALGASANHDHAIVNASALSKYTPRLMDIFADVILHPNFPEDELKLKKTNLVQELSIKRSEPDFLLEERFNKVAFGDHPYAIVSPTEETVNAMTKEDLQKFHGKYYLPNQSYLVVVGDFDLEKMKSLVEEKFGKDWQKNETAQTISPQMPKQKGKTIYVVDRPGSVQSSIKLGNISIKKTDADYFPFVVANQILGGATNSRLFLNIREQKGYTYGAYSGVGARKEPGAFAAEAEVRTDVTAPSLEESKSYLAGSFQLGLETQSGLTTRLLERKLYNLPDDYLETYVDKIMAVNADQVREVAKKHIDLDNIIICIVGDASKIKPDLQYFADVDVYDMTGKPLGLSSDANNNFASKQSSFQK
jgi:predicted Zn-dependent peptidase